LNVALFGCTAKDWRTANPDLVVKAMNIRDFASINELAVLSNLETINAQMIKEEISKNSRFVKLKEIAKYQIEILNDLDYLKTIKRLNDAVFIDQKNT
jgi:hypothetical protein